MICSACGAPFMCATIKNSHFWHDMECALWISFFVRPHVIYDGLMQLDVVWVTKTVVCLFSLLYQRNNNAHDVRELQWFVYPLIHVHQVGVERIWIVAEIEVFFNKSGTMRSFLQPTSISYNVIHCTTCCRQIL